MAGIVGAAGLAPTLAAVRRGAMVALANKECLVCAGALFMAEVRRHGATLLPVDSEHNAILQALAGNDRAGVRRLILTASGGPFRTWSLAEMRGATPEQAVRHPNWSMGAKISVDSATMMNKGLEIIEAHHLFAMPEAAIEVVVHPQSIVHSLVGFSDGSVLAQLARPTCASRSPTRWAGRAGSRPAPRGSTCAPHSRPGLRAARPRALPGAAAGPPRLAGGGAAHCAERRQRGGGGGFLARRIGFLDIARSSRQVLERLRRPQPVMISTAVVAYDAEARRVAAEIAGRRPAPARHL